MDTQVETLEFQAEARQLLSLLIHSIYSNKDVFLRELISNASDALDKLRLAARRDKDLDADVSDLHIELEVDQQERTLTVRDNGIGMSRAEVVELIGTIARSGTAELLRKLKEAQDSAASQELIGQFGIGFYASFMVADRVTLVTRRAGETGGTRWESRGEGTYTIEAVPDAPQGTSVTLHLKPADEEDHLYDYTVGWKLKEIVKQHSDFIAWPIKLDGETVNSMKALWARPKDEVEDSEYREFYNHISHDWAAPLETIHMKAEGTFEYEALLFIPSHAPFDLFARAGKRGIQLYVRRVFIMDDCEELVPQYLRFVKGVVDAADLSLNVSREILQQDRQIQLMRRRLSRKVLTTLRYMATDKPEAYATFWKEFGAVLKEGLVSDTENRESIFAACSFASTRDSEELTTLAGYVERMKEGQRDIYYMTGESRQTIESSPHLEAFRAKGYEVLLLTDPVDEIWVDAVSEFDGKPLRSIAKGQIDLDAADGGERQEQQREDFADLLSFLAAKLEEQVKEVRLSTRLTSSAACLVSDANDVTPTLERMYRAMGQPVPHTKRILELNPDHPLVTGLRQAHADRSEDPDLAGTAELLYVWHYWRRAGTCPTRPGSPACSPTG